MPAPRPGRPVRGSRSGRPIMALLDLLGRRWSLRVLWELAQEPAGFRLLQTRCDAMSPSVLAQRLTELRAAGIVTQLATGDYALTEDGRDLVQALAPLNTWAAQWAARLGARSDCDAQHPASQVPAKPGLRRGPASSAPASGDPVPC